MYFRILADSGDDRLAYLLADLEEQEAVVVDPWPTQTGVIAAMLDERELRLRFVLRTHVHAGDEAACDALCRHTGATLVTGTHARAQDGGRRVAHGEHLVFGNELLRALDTPGHTPGCVSYLWRDRLFCGDALDVPACIDGDGECDPGRLFDTLTRRLFILPAETLVFPAHALHGRGVTTIAEERRRHARLSAISREAFVTELSLNGELVRATGGGSSRGDREHAQGTVAVVTAQARGENDGPRRIW
ncbi:MAG TPA: MBL fold metallo-hydrolase [Rhodocyclaceae bacterium]|nr:MBL fold metallo-hydrolase [Rhodocyclaceae bacterium]